MFIPFYVLFYSLKAEDEKFSPLCPHQLLIDPHQLYIEPHHLLVDHKAKSSVIAKLTENKFFCLCRRLASQLRICHLGF